MLFQSTLPRRERLERKLHNKQTDIISIHAPAKGATSRPTSISSTAAFQSTLPRRERPPTQATPTARHDTFQSTLPRRERPTIKRSAKLNQSFQSTLPRRERHVVRAVSVKYDSVFQSTLPRRERRFGDRRQADRGRQFQSTLPRRERHVPRSTGGRIACISIHAPAKGATAAALVICTCRPDFNPRSREGSDVDSSLSHKGIPISIHAPAKGATPCAASLSQSPPFQSTLPRRERRDPAVCGYLAALFQSTLPRRERLDCLISSRADAVISIHAPAKGATCFSPLSGELEMPISIHAPAKGATPAAVSR